MTPKIDRRRATAESRLQGRIADPGSGGFGPPCSEPARISRAERTSGKDQSSGLKKPARGGWGWPVCAWALIESEMFYPTPTGLFRLQSSLGPSHDESHQHDSVSAPPNTPTRPRPRPAYSAVFRDAAAAYAGAWAAQEG